MTVFYAQRKAGSVVAFVYDESNSYQTYCNEANVLWYSGPQFIVGPGLDVQSPVVGNVYYAPEQSGTSPSTRYLLEFTPEQWEDLYNGLVWEGPVQP